MITTTNRSYNIQDVNKKTLSWLLYSEITDNREGFSDYGGVYAWKDPNSEKKEFLYSEISGYYLTYLSYLYYTNKGLRNELVKKMRATTEWLMNQALAPNNTGFWYKKFEHEKDFRKKIYTFDNAMCINGLLHVLKIINHAEYYNVSKNILNSLIKNLINKRHLKPIVTNNTQIPIDYSKWSNQEGSFLIKCIIPLINYHEKASDLIDSVDKYIKVQLDVFYKNGRFITDIMKNTYVHPFLYTLEGLWVIGITYDKSEYLELVREGIDWLLDNKTMNGFLSGYIDPCGKTKIDGIGTDALSQLIRLMVLLSYDRKKIDPLVNELITTRYVAVKDKKFGAYVYGYAIDGVFYKHLNSWSSMFSYQALDILNDAQARKLLIQKPTLLI
ncbi:TPA: hypothetical protein QC063_003046 [Bacillus cereus]|nr:hypothetical protein [Bacillus cereus]